MKKYLLILTLFTCVLFMNASAQHIPDYGHMRVRLTDTGRTIVAEILPFGASPRLSKLKTYYWYESGHIHQLQGGISGKPLHGLYQEYYLNKNLRTQGYFEKGLKSKEWKEWSENGILLNVITWHNGVKSGKFSYYNADGSLKQTGTYQDNALDGKITFYEGADSLRTVLYKQGKELPEDKRSFFRKLNPFKKKPSDQK